MQTRAISRGDASQDTTQTIRITRNGTQPSVKGTADTFSGSVRIDQRFEASDPARVHRASVTFEPGARTAWHAHPLGQTLIVTAGYGLVHFSIVQLSDLHIGLLLKEGWLNEVVRTTNALASDLVVLTGDMIDDSPEALQEDIAPLRALRAKHGVYGITGNHEYYFGAHRWLPVFEDLGIVMLQNDYRTFSVQGKTLVLAGVPDPAALPFGEVGPDHGFVQALPDGLRVLLQHRPSVLTGDTTVDLQLSGHTHGGHLFFLKWLIASLNGGLVGGLFDFEGAKLYVSPGTGVWAGFSCRLGAASEIAHIILRQQQGS